MRKNIMFVGAMIAGLAMTAACTTTTVESEESIDSIFDDFDKEMDKLKDETTEQIDEMKTDATQQMDEVKESATEATKTK